MKPETNGDSHKEKLQNIVLENREALTNEALVIGERMQELLKKALLIGGGVALGYLAYRQLTGSKKKNSGMMMALLSTVGSALMTEQGRNLVGKGKEKITQLLSK